MPVLQAKSYVIGTGPVAAMAIGGGVAAAAGGVTKFADPEVASFVRIFTTAPEQQRNKAVLRCDPLLMNAAKARAEDMANRRYFNHTDPDGNGPNHYARQAGYNLPYGTAADKSGNQIESISAGAMTGERTWQSWMDSPNHKIHLTGADAFFREQVDYGIWRANVPGSPYTFYWVFLSSRPVR